MSRRKHVMLGLRQDIEPPTELQRVVQVVGPRGGNIVEVAYPDGRQTLCLLPSKFNKKLWVKRGGYLLIEEGQASTVTAPADDAGAVDAASTSQPAAGGKVTGTIIAVLYEEHIKQLKKMAGAWPPEFDTTRSTSSTGHHRDVSLPEQSCSEDETEEGAQEQATHSQQQGDGIHSQPGDGACNGVGGSDAGTDSDSDSGLPPLEQNTNRKVIVYEDTDDEEDDD